MIRNSRILRYASDLHLELKPSILHPKLIAYWKFKTYPSVEQSLALLGDIGNPYHHNLNLFLQKVSKKYHKIFYVPETMNIIILM